MNAICRKALVLSVVCLFTWDSARAQPGPAETDSIDSLVANGDLVLVARLLEPQPTADGGGGRMLWVLSIEETLRAGPASAWRSLERMAVDLPASPADLDDWKRRSCRLLIMVDADKPVLTRIIELKERMAVFNADMTLLKDQDAVLSAARKAVRSLPSGVKRMHTFALSVPRTLVTGLDGVGDSKAWEDSFQAGGGLSLRVPVDGMLEERARNALGSTNVYRRCEGVRALLHFKSEENISRLKLLLDDPGETRHSKGDRVEVSYPVRSLAREVLSAWGIPEHVNGGRNPGDSPKSD